jgi:hypothetical protein
MSPRNPAEGLKIPWPLVGVAVTLLMAMAANYAKIMVIESKVDLLYKIQYEQGSFGPRPQKGHP